jgi:hypothetical protein
MFRFLYQIDNLTVDTALSVELSQGAVDHLTLSKVVESYEGVIERFIWSSKRAHLGRNQHTLS